MPDPRTFLHPIPRAWVATGPYGAPNYDEFADCSAVRAAFDARPDSIVAVDNPSCFPGGMAASLAGLRQRQEDGRLASAHGLFLYAMDDALAVIGLVSTDEVSSGPAEPGRLFRNEEVFADKVVERQALIEETGHLISPVLLVPESTEALRSLEIPAVSPLVEETDERGVRHRVWHLPDAAAVSAALDATAFVVADGNHRTLASQRSGRGWCLAVVADPAGLRIAPYHRLLATDRDVLAAAAPLHPTPADRDPARTQLYTAGRVYDLDLPVVGDAVERLPHTVLERELVVGGLGLDPAAVTYVGGDADPTDRVDSGEYAAALLMRPVTVAEFTAVNAARLQMPRKSTWFLPKARSGLVVAEL